MHESQPTTSHAAGSPAPAAGPSDSYVRAERIDPRLRLAAATRLIGQGLAAGQRFLDAASRLGIDVSLMWGTVEGGKRVRQVCLAVCGAGRTAMLFISGDAAGSASTGDAHVERVAAIRAACEFIGSPVHAGGKGVRLAQALLEPREQAAAAALRAAGFLQLGNLEYLRLAPIIGHGASSAVPPAPGEWPGGVRVRRVADLSRPEADRLLLSAMEKSYEDTLDCPELCGLRDVKDVLESHRAVGAHDPSLWWVATRDGVEGGEACMLLSPCPEQETIELVYLGLSPALRGKGLARALLQHGLAALERKRLTPSGGLTCAVDTRNTPALRLYGSMGFESFATREPYVLPLPVARPE